MTLIDLKNELSKRNINLTTDMIKQLDFYAKYLIEYNKKINLTSINEYEEIIDKHFYDSLLWIDRDLKGKLVDVGTGAGFPGLVIKILFSELNVILLEPIKKKCIFLESIINELSLNNVIVINQRGEDFSLDHREEFNYVIARAVTNLNNLIEIAGSMVKENNYFICLRGKKGIEEIEEATNAIKKMGFEIEFIKKDNLFCGDERIISYFIKKDKTNIKYPRKYNIIKKNPL